MSLQDGKWDYEPEVLTLLNDMMDKEPFEVIRAVESNRKGLVFNGIIMQFQLRLHMSPDKAVKRINYWMKWRTLSWTFKCTRCGAEHQADGRPDNIGVAGIGCTCGAFYEIDGWKSYRRDDTSGGNTTFSIAVDGQETKVSSLEEADKVLSKLGGRGLIVNKVRVNNS